MRASTERKLHLLHASGHRPDLQAMKTFRDFDDAVTAPLHGFQGADEYYERCSSIGYLRHVVTPTLILHALDDPFMTRDIVPGEDELSPAVTLELSANGGHVGFVSGRLPWKPRYWLEERIIRHLNDAYISRQAERDVA